MPKMKTHSGAKKRFKITGSGKVAFQKAGRRHLMKSKNTKKLRRMRQQGILTPSFEDHIKRQMPYA